ncbi:PadR family transcriptional regulator [Rhodovastum atsumiense]|uniref:PadR family transcriptional regulator n=1 Tax=Rhodovastum atsumiense TaxID=504468 RepID=A0A5M6IP34_9PROT|nr:PadR family transcriptional regulator [Rhodovastum atsumiense]KAA5610022.1 PadR family transcriptional regulator [Rhodovastum atsumiense]CAH2602993.1 PadR family transcriptional regulator [Rhodovastum atsumiense]
MFGFRSIHAIGRQHGRGRFGHGAGGFGRGFMGGGDGFPGGRKLSAADLQLVLLALLAERPAHGYDLIRTLEERSGGFYAPSPGMIYPALTYLEESGHAVTTPEGNRKLYTLTEAGQAHLQAHRDEVTLILDLLARIGGRMGEVREAFAGVGDADPQSAEELHRARHALKHALMRKRGCGPEEARRIARILERAAAEILGPAR